MNENLTDYAAFVKLVIEALESAGIEYLIGGAVAAWVWGEARSTRDLDLVVEIPLEAVSQLSEELQKRDMLVPADVILDAILDNRADVPINAIHLYSGFKADLYLVRPEDELCRSAFGRRKQIDLGPPLGTVYVHAPEDLIIYKLWYYSLSWQTKHPRDIEAILQTSRDQIDFEYIQQWVDRKGLALLWKELLDKTQG